MRIQMSKHRPGGEGRVEKTCLFRVSLGGMTSSKVGGVKKWGAWKHQGKIWGQVLRNLP